MKVSKVIMWVGVAAVLGVLAFTLTRPAGTVKKDVDGAELRTLVSSGARLIDVRSAGEFAMGHIEGAQNVPVEDIEAAASTWDPDQAFVLYCATGQRSLTAMNMLANKGFKKLYNLPGGVASYDEKLTTAPSEMTGIIKANGKPVLVEFSSDG